MQGAGVVGRERELAAVGAALARLGDGESGLLAIIGDPGIGKTRLLEELAERGADAGHLVLSGAASEFERDLPFSVFVDALDAYLGSLASAELSRRGIEDVPELG